jgi:hypothetical protein
MRGCRSTAPSRRRRGRRLAGATTIDAFAHDGHVLTKGHVARQASALLGYLAGDHATPSRVDGCEFRYARTVGYERHARRHRAAWTAADYHCSGA